MDIIQITAIGIIAAVLSTIIKQYKPELAMQISIITGVIIFFSVLSSLGAILNILEELTLKTDIDTKYISIILKIIGAAYVCEFGVSICKDAGESAIAAKIEFGGKILILVMAVPILISLLNLLLAITV